MDHIHKNKKWMGEIRCSPWWGNAPAEGNIRDRLNCSLHRHLNGLRSHSKSSCLIKHSEHHTLRHTYLVLFPFLHLQILFFSVLKTHHATSNHRPACSTWNEISLHQSQAPFRQVVLEMRPLPWEYPSVNRHCMTMSINVSFPLDCKPQKKQGWCLFSHYCT